MRGVTPPRLGLWNLDQGPKSRIRRTRQPLAVSDCPAVAAGHFSAMASFPQTWVEVRAEDQATHLRLYALVHAAPVIHALAVGGLSQSELAGARTLIEVLAPDAARSLALFLLFFRREDVRLVQILAATIQNSAATEVIKAY